MKTISVSLIRMQNRRKFIAKAGLLSLTGMFLPEKIIANPIFEKRKVLKAPALHGGDTVAITSPAGAVWDQEGVDKFASILKSFGFKVVIGKTLTEKFGYFAGTDAFRAKELNDLFADKNIKGIFCMKGGWGCARILDLLDYSLIEKNPKVFIGFSDITTLLIAIHQRTGLITFHGPVGNSGWNDFTRDVFLNTIINGKEVSYPENPAIEEKITCIKEGIVKGELIGGNLTVLTSLMGSKYLPDWKGKILFLEEAKEEPYSIDRMLTQLKLCGVLSEISGFIFGKCAKCFAEEPEKAFTFEQVLKQHIEPLGIPAFYGAMIGHIENKLTLPIGSLVRMDAAKGEITLLETAVG